MLSNSSPRLRIQRSWTTLRRQTIYSTIRNLSSPKPGYSTGGSGLGSAWRGGAWRRGGALWDGTGHQRVGPPRRQLTLLTLGAWKTTVQDDSSEARTNEVLFKSEEEQNILLTWGTASALCSWLLTSGLSPICLCKPLSCEAYPGICNSNTRISHGRRGAAKHGGWDETRLGEARRVAPEPGIAQRGEAAGAERGRGRSARRGSAPG